MNYRSPGRGTVYILMTLLVFMAIALSYYFYVQDQGRTLRGRHLRTLGSISESLSGKVLNLSKPLQTVVRAVSTSKDYASSEEMYQDLLLQLGKIRGLNWSPSDIRIEDQTPDLPQGQRDIQIKVDRSRLELTWDYPFQAVFLEPAETRNLILKMRFNVDKVGLFESLVYRDLFDYLMVLEYSDKEDNPARFIYQRNDGERFIQQLRELSLPDGQPWNFARETGRSSIARVTIADESFYLFSQPVKIQSLDIAGIPASGDPWVVIGLVRQDKMKAGSFAFSSAVAIVALMLLLIGIFSVPLLRFRYMSRNDDMGLSQVVTIFLALFLIAFLVTLSILDLFVHFHLQDRRDVELSEFSRSVQDRFIHELELSLIQLNELDQLMGTIQTANQWADRVEEGFDVNSLEESVHPPAEFVLLLDAIRSGRIESRDQALEEGYSPEAWTLVAGTRYRQNEQLVNLFDALCLDVTNMANPFFKMATWADPTGNQRLRWQTTSKPTPLTSEAEANWFANIKSGKDWRVTFNTNLKPPTAYDCYIQAVRSWNTNNFEVMLSRQTQTDQWREDGFNGVASMVTSFRSLENPVLPASSGFAVINRDGDVLFHSDSVRNLQENLFVETDHDPNLQSLVYSGVTETLSINYMNRPFRFHITPIHNGIPWSLVVFQEREPQRSFNLIFLTQVSIIFLVYMVLMIVVILIIGFFYPSESSRRWWLWPDRKNCTAYRELCIIYLLLSFANLVNFFGGNGEGAMLINLCFCGVLTIMMTYIKMGRQAQFNPRHASSRSQASGYWILRRFPLIAIVIFLMIFNSNQGVVVFLGLPTGILFPLCLIPLIYLSSSFLEKGSNGSPRQGADEAARLPWFKRLIGEILSPDAPVMQFWKNLKNLYSVTIVCFCVTLVIIPVLVLTRVSFEFEYKLMTKYHQLHILQSLHKRDQFFIQQRERAVSQIRQNSRDMKMDCPDSPKMIQILDEQLRLFPSTSFAANVFSDGYAADIFTNSHFINKIEQKETPVVPPRTSDFRNLVPRIMARLIPSYNEITRGQRYLTDDRAQGRTFFWSTNNRKIDLADGQPNVREKYYVITSQNLELGRVLTLESMLFIFLTLVALCFLLWLLFSLVRKITHRLYLMELNSEEVKNLKDIRSLLENQDKVQVREHFLVLGPCFPSQELVDLDTILVLDFARENQIGEDDWLDRKIKELVIRDRTVVLSNFDYIQAGRKAEWDRISVKKFRLLEKLIEADDLSVFIFSQFDPVIHFDPIANILVPLHTGSESKPGEKIPEVVSLDWVTLMRSFHTVSFRLTVEDECLPEYLKPWRWEFSIWPELKQLVPEPQDNNGSAISDKPSDLDMAIRFKRYYQNIWNNCTRLERQVMYDLAKDGFVNPVNIEVMRYLFRRGLVEIEGGLKFQSESLRLFVLDSYTEQDSMPTENKSELSWDLLKIPLFMILIGGAAFLALTQKELSQLFMTLASTVILGVIPLVLKGLGIIDKS